MRKLIVVLILLIILSVTTVSGQTLPYPASPVIESITWDFANLVSLAPGSDLWPVTWGPDGHIYTSWGDGGGFGGDNNDGRVSLGFARIQGPPDSFVTANVWGGKNPENPAQFGGKCSGIASVDGILYAWCWPQDSSPPYMKLFWSSDLGATWQANTWSFGQSDTLRDISFLQFGQDYQGDRDGFVYSYALERGDSSDPSGFLFTSGLALLRVPKGHSNIIDRNAYEFFAGLDANGDPIWTSDIGQRQPVFTDPNGVGIPGVSYNPGINRYLLTTAHGPNADGVNKLGVFDAPEPWGPWTVAQYNENWGGFSGFWLAYYIPTSAPDWLSADGQTFHLIFSGQSALDSFNLVKATITLKTQDATPPTAPAGLTPTPVSQSQIDLSWSAATDPESGVSGYRVYRDNALVGSPSGTGFSDTGLAEGTGYSYEVSAVNGAGLEGARSAPVPGTTLADTTPPALDSVSPGGDLATVIVVFSEPVAEAGATDSANYSIDNGIAVSSASLAGDLKTVTLSATSHTQGVSYTLTVSNVTDRAATPNPILPGAQAGYTFVDQLIVSNLSADSGLAYEVVDDGLVSGALVYTDRSFTYTSIPPSIDGATYIKPANDDKAESSDPFLSFTVNQGVTVYVAYDDRASSLPDWMSDWSPTGEVLGTTDVDHDLFSKGFDPGQITLGANLAAGASGARSNYTIVVVGNGTPAWNGNVSFSMALQGREDTPGPSWSMPFNVSLYLPGTSTLAESFSPTTATSTTRDGSFVVTVTPGGYDVWVKGENTLAMLLSNLDLTVKPAGAVDLGTQEGGDFDGTQGDNLVAVQDYTAVLTAFGSLTADLPAAQRPLDHNRDGIIDLIDYTIILQNFNDPGAPDPGG